MIKSITVTNNIGESLTLELRFPEKSGFLVLSASGLGPSKATINATEMATNDGSIVNSTRVTPRNIVLSLKLLEKPTIEDTRQRSYKYFPLKQKVRIVIETDNRLCETYGIVESNEPQIFSSSETTQISIFCPDPYFYSTGKNGNNVTVFSGIAPMFSFPFSNESLTGNFIKVGEIVTNQEQTVYYTGDAEIGVVITIHALDVVGDITIYNSTTRQIMKINASRLQTLTGSGIIAGDSIIISTIKGEKGIKLLRNGKYTNILNCLDRNAEWFYLKKGDNVFAYSSDIGATNLQFKITNRSVYEGV